LYSWVSRSNWSVSPILGKIFAVCYIDFNYFTAERIDIWRLVGHSSILTILQRVFGWGLWFLTILVACVLNELFWPRGLIDIIFGSLTILSRLTEILALPRSRFWIDSIFGSFDGTLWCLANLLAPEPLTLSLWLFAN